MYEGPKKELRTIYAYLPFFFFKYFLWHPNAGPVIGPKHVAVLQQMNSCVGQKFYTFIILISSFIAFLYFRMPTAFLLCFRQFHLNLFCDPRWW